MGPVVCRKNGFFSTLLMKSDLLSRIRAWSRHIIPCNWFLGFCCTFQCKSKLDILRPVSVDWYSSVHSEEPVDESPKQRLKGDICSGWIYQTRTWAKSKTTQVDTCCLVPQKALASRFKHVKTDHASFSQGETIWLSVRLHYHVDQIS